MKKIYVVALIFLAVQILIYIDSCRPTSLTVPVDGLITGYVFTEVSLAGLNNPKKVFLPDVIVTVKDSLGNIYAIDTTDLDGGFRTKDIKHGNYKLTLSKLHYSNTTYNANVRFATNHPGQLKINHDAKQFIYGTAKLADGVPGFFRNDVFGVNFFTTVSAIDTPLNTVRCNTAGEFVLLGVKPNRNYNVSAKCQNAVINQTFQADNNTHNLIFKNTRPIIQNIVAFEQSGKAVLRTLPSTKLKLEAQTLDKEGQPLTYMWKPSGSYPGSSFSNNREAIWQLTPIKAKNSVTLLVLDNYGGASFKTFNIEDNDGKVAFSGVVQDIENNEKIADAIVKINGNEVARTSSNGYFSVRVNESENNRYVLNIEKPGFMLRSLIFRKEAFEQTYKLVKATVKEFDPNNDIVLTEEEDKFTKFTQQDTPRARVRIAASVKIPKGSIVDESGNKVVTPVNVQIRTIDLYNTQGLMPGDYAAIEGGIDKTLVSFGAIDIQIRDKANPEKRYNLNKESSAEINIPISSDIVEAAPANIGLWDYNETTGIWEKIASIGKSGNKYVGTTNSFSSINTDVAITGGTCLFLQDNPNNPIFPGSDCDVTITIPTGGAPKIMHTTITSADPTLVIARLPLNEDISIVVNRGLTVVAARTIHTASVTSPDASSINPANPSTSCSVDYYKKDPPIADVGSSSAPFLSRILTLSETDAIAYYVSIGAITDLNSNSIFELTEGETFAQWKTRNGFNSGDDAHAVYFNAGDLGFHRAMHQKGTGSHVAFYVSNYGNFVDAENNVFGTGAPIPDATVAMEYDFNSSTGTRGIIKFFLFKGPSETLETHVDLDGNGEKFIPGLCIECHGGREDNYASIAPNGLQNHYAITANVDHVPAFLAFDAQSFTYSAAHDRLSQETQLRNLNQKVLDANATQGIRDFLNAAYGSTSGTLLGNFIDNSVAAGWLAGNTNGVSNSFFYPSVVGPSCRTCHSSKSANLSLQFNIPSNFSAFPVCGPGKYMPNAKVTFNNFWLSSNPYQPEQLRLFAGQPICE